MATKYNSKNERLKKEYICHLGKGLGRSPATLDGIRKSLLRYEEYHRFKDFAPLHHKQAISFSDHLSGQKAQRTGKPLSMSTQLCTMNHLKAFFLWLQCKQGFRTKIHLPDIEYFRLSLKDTRIARNPKHKPVPTPEQIERVLHSMPADTEIALRNRALIAFVYLTGVRDSALISLKLRHVRLEDDLVLQDPSDGVKTKFSKRIDTYFFPVGDDMRQIVADWMKFLFEKKLCGNEAPLFPRTCVARDGNASYHVAGLEPEHWRTTAPVREIFREAFTAAGLPYYNPHSFRNTLVMIAQRRNLGGEALKAWSQNLGHETVATTVNSYGRIDPHRQGEVIKGLAEKLIE